MSTPKPSVFMITKHDSRGVKSNGSTETEDKQQHKSARKETLQAVWVNHLDFLPAD